MTGKGSAPRAFLSLFVFGLFAVLCLVMGAAQAAQAADQSDQRGTEGVYQIKAQIVHATQVGQVSMAQAAFDNVLEPGTAKRVTAQYNKDYEANNKKGKTTTPPQYTLTLVVKNGKSYLLSRMVPIDRRLGSSSFTGYLGFLDYYPSYQGSTSPFNQSPTAALTDSYYTGSADKHGDNKNLKKGYDSYNNPKTGTDAALKGMKYSQDVSMRINAAKPELWIRVYVPVMESINQGSGTQFAKIELDYNTMERIDPETQADKYEAAEAIAEHHEKAVAGGYQELANEITVASKLMLQHLSKKTYTSTSWSKYTKALKALRSQRNDAQKVYAAHASSGADSADVQSAVSKLKASEKQFRAAEKSLKKTKKAKAAAKTRAKSTAKRTAKDVKLKFAKLPDGTYTVYGEMIKTDRQQQSMSNKAIDHNIRIKVRNGKYTVQMTFAKLHYSGKVGALGKLWYFKHGYGHANGTLSGSRARAKTLSYLTAGDGSRFKDEYGTDYPKTVSFPLISEAKGDGWVPLQVFVPVMEGISAGTGTQGVYLKLHTGTVVGGTKEVAGSSTGTDTDGDTAGSASGSDEGGDSVGSLPGASDSDSGDTGGTVKPTAKSSEGDSDGSAAAAAAGTDSDAGSGDADDNSGSAQGSNTATADQSAMVTSESEPPMKRYLGLMGGGAAACVFAGLGYALIRRRAQIAALIGAAR